MASSKKDTLPTRDQLVTLSGFMPFRPTESITALSERQIIIGELKLHFRDAKSKCDCDDCANFELTQNRPVNSTT